MTVKRKGPFEISDALQPKGKKAKEDDFFGGFSTPAEDGSSCVAVKPNTKNNKKNKKNAAGNNFKTDPNKNIPEWVKGSGEQLQKYIKHTQLVDIESLIQQYLKENNIEIIDGIIAEQKADGYKNNEGKLKVKSSELMRMERLKHSNATATKSEEDQKVEDYFRDATKIDENKTFKSMDLHKKLMMAIRDLKYTKPTPIQSATVPVAIAGKDICGCAATGTGKTAAYALPTLDRLLQANRKGPPVTRVLVIVPTRELGVQVFQVFQSLTKYTNIQTSLVLGGLTSKAQEKELLKKPDVVIATPGRLVSYIKNLKGFCLEHVEVLILDEADRILDDYFEEQMADIISRCSPHRQTLLFSATMTTEVHRVATAALKEPVKIFVNSNKNVAQGLRQEYVLMRDGEDETRNATLVYLLVHVFSNNTIVFLPTKSLCHRLYVVLRLCGLRVGELHSKLPQSARLHNLALFANGHLRVLLATDLAARGLDIKGVDTVINYKLNSSYEMYVHRVGRTARAGHEGLAISLVPRNEYNSLKVIKKNSNTMMYQRIIDKQAVQEWKGKMDKLNEVCSRIIERETATLKEKEETEIKDRINFIVAKNEKRLKRNQRVEKRAKPTTGRKPIREVAKEEGLTVDEYKEKKRFASSRVSNSKKKRMLRFKERQENPILRIKKTVLTKIDIHEVKTPVTFPVVMKKKNKRVVVAGKAKQADA